MKLHGLYEFPEHVLFSVAVVVSEGLLVCSAVLTSTASGLGDPRASGELESGVHDVARLA